MKSLVIVIMALLGSSVGVPLQAATATAVQADSAYAQERYHDALGNYQLMMQEQGVSSKLFYNMGNTYYKMNDYAHAIICYEKALMLDPTCTQARENLEFVNQKLKLPVAMGSRSFVTQVAQSVAFLFTSNGWAIVALITFILCLIAVAIYVFRREVLWRKLGFFSALALLVLTALAITCSLYLRNRATNSKAAIVVSQSATLSTAPRTPSASEVAFKLPLGSKVEVNDSVATKSEGDSHKWYQVQAANGRIAWIDDDDVELLKI